MSKKTPLYDEHVRLQGKIVEYAGYELPVQYPTGVIQEHMAVRQGAGLFDVSHMGEVTFKGEKALENLNYLLTNDFTSLKPGRVRYSVMCYEDGGCVDDLIVYCKKENDYLVVVNAANKDKDVQWMKQHLMEGVEFADISDEVAQIALQGPLSKEILGKLCELPEKYYSFIETKIVDKSCLVSQTGYTGEHGYEIYCANDAVVDIYRAILEDERVVPCGLGARDTLRLEASMPLYGHEMDETISPLETGLDFGVKLTKDFIGKEGIENRKNRHRIGLKITARGIARENCDVYQDGKCIGHTTSGTHCPYLGGAYAMALVEEELPIGSEVKINVRGKEVGAEVCALPFYKREG